MNVLSHLGCDKVFDYFEKICDIPHGSFHEKALSDYIVSFAKERGLYCRQDNKMNVLIYKGDDHPYPGDHGISDAWTEEGRSAWRRVWSYKFYQ